MFQSRRGKPLGPGSRIKKRKMSHGGTSNFLIHITEYFKNLKFQNRATREFEKTTFLTYNGDKTTVEWPKFVSETIFIFWILNVLCDVYPKIWSPIMGIFLFLTRLPGTSEGNFWRVLTKFIITPIKPFSHSLWQTSTGFSVSNFWSRFVCWHFSFHKCQYFLGFENYTFC